ncbi:HNH endonuclease [Bacillus sp. UMB0728]|uniref:HNH endonuclease n=1 Tax=Bacillus sp. UMB0728 TaxID=2066052 RepID=UPI000C7840AD|nr:HNH endonuclease [Bacillus sp. UMB0728]PLR72201.1 endonuclease [Bacillus sp. UMB0728]
MEEKEQRKKIRKQKKYNETHKLISGVDHKVCTDCDKWFPSNEEYFYNNNKNSIDGLKPQCKSCSIIRSRNRQLSNHEEYKEYLKAWVKENKEIYEHHKKVWELENPEHAKELRRSWRRNNKEKINNYNLYRRMHKSHEISNEEKKKCKEYFNYSCAYCNLTEKEHYLIHEQQLHMDHVDPNGANDLSNNVPACKTCNVKKRDRDVHDFYQLYDIKPSNQEIVSKWLSGDFLLCLDSK